MTKIVCGRFDNIIDFEGVENVKIRKVRLGSINPNQYTDISYSHMSTNGREIYFEGKIYDANDFLHSKNLKNLMVLTYRERDLILEKLSNFGKSVVVFEGMYPVFSNVRYTSDIQVMYEELLSLEKAIKGFGIRNDRLSKQCSELNRYKIERKIRYKNNLDKYFGFAYKGGYQEVFKVREERKDRVIIAFDFNSMYSDCMKGEFLKPKEIKYKKINSKDVELKNLSPGLYRVNLINPINTTFNKIHPFKYTRNNKSYSFEMEKYQTIEILLFKNEVIYYSEFFERTLVLEGFVSEKAMPHPLFKDAQKSYKKRLLSRVSNNSVLEKLHKLKLVYMHSSTNPVRMKKFCSSNIEYICGYLSKNYMLNDCKDSCGESYLRSLSKSKYFDFKKNKDEYNVCAIDFSHRDCIYSLSSQVLANSRLKIIKTAMSFSNQKSVELCYSNIDSIHISIIKENVSGFLERNKDLISDDMGDLKVQFFADRGYWFDTGRYWVFKGSRLVSFKNILFNFIGNKEPFSFRRLIPVRIRVGLFDYVKDLYFNLDNSFGYSKKLSTDKVGYRNFNRYMYSDICENYKAINSYSDEMLRSRKYKIDLFNRVRCVDQN